MRIRIRNTGLKHLKSVKKNKLSKQTAEARAGAENLGHLPRDLGCPVFTVHLRILLSCRAA